MVNGHPMKAASPIAKSEPEYLQEWDLPPHMTRPFSDPVLTQAINQINAPHQYDELTEDFGRQRVAAQWVTDTSITVPQLEGSSSYKTNPMLTMVAPLSTGWQGRTLSNNVSIAELYLPLNCIPLLDQWEDHISFQWLCDAAIAKTGHSCINDQCLHFVGHRLLATFTTS